MTLAILGTFVGLLVSILGIAVSYFQGWLESPRRREEREQVKAAAEQSNAVADAILGEREVRDFGGGIITPARSGLVDRVSEVEQAVNTLTEVIANQQATDRRVDVLETRADGTDQVIAGIIANTFKAGADSALAAVHKPGEDVIDGEVDDE